MKLSLKNLFAGTMLLLGGMPQAMACSVCFGDPNTLQSKALAVAVLFLLGTVGAVLGAIAYSIFTWSRRSKELSEAA